MYAVALLRSYFTLARSSNIVSDSKVGIGQHPLLRHETDRTRVSCLEVNGMSGPVMNAGSSSAIIIIKPCFHWTAKEGEQ